MSLFCAMPTVTGMPGGAADAAAARALSRLAWSMKKYPAAATANRTVIATAMPDFLTLAIPS